MPAWLTSPLRLITAARLIRSRACRGCVPAAGVQRAAANVGARGCSAAAPCPGSSPGSRRGAAVLLAPGAAQGDGRLLGNQIILSKIPFQNPSLFPKAPKPAAPHHFRTGLGQKLSPSPATGHRSCHLLQVARESFSWAPCCSWKGLGACSGFPDVSFCRCRQMCYFFLPRGPAEMQRNKWAL